MKRSMIIEKIYTKQRVLCGPFSFMLSPAIRAGIQKQIDDLKDQFAKVEEKPELWYISLN